MLFLIMAAKSFKKSTDVAHGSMQVVIINLTADSSLCSNYNKKYAFDVTCNSAVTFYILCQIIFLHFDCLSLTYDPLRDRRAQLFLSYKSCRVFTH